MISQDPLRHSENEATLHAWQSEIERSAPTPWLAQALAARVSDLLPRVTTCHTQLRALPRRTRRAWQRQLARSSKLTAVLQDWSQRRAGRALQRQLARSVAGAALLLALAHGVGHAATITVTTNIPAINAADGKCSLIEAIENANAEALPRPHTDCAAGDAGADIIVLPKATHALGAVNNDTFYATGLPVITSEITIEGHDAKITRKASAPRFRLLAVSATGDLTLKDVTLSGGDAEGYGGAIHNEGTLTIQNSTVSGNDAGFIGGGISNYLGTITIDHSTISGNTAGKGSFDRRWRRHRQRRYRDPHEQHDLGQSSDGTGWQLRGWWDRQSGHPDRREEHHLRQYGRWSLRHRGWDSKHQRYDNHREQHDLRQQGQWEVRLRGWDRQREHPDHREQHDLGEQGRPQVRLRGWHRQHAATSRSIGA